MHDMPHAAITSDLNCTIPAGPPRRVPARILGHLHLSPPSHQRSAPHPPQVEGALDAANMLKPALARGTLHCIGATTHEEFERHIAQDAALARRFQPLPVPEPTPAEALAILRGLQCRYEAFHAVTYTPAALECAVTCAVQYTSARRLPDSAVDIIDEAAAYASSLAPHAVVGTGAAQSSAPPPPPALSPLCNDRSHCSGACSGTARAQGLDWPAPGALVADGATLVHHRRA